MYEPITLSGTEGLYFIVNNGGISYESNSIIQIEEAFILGTEKWFDYLKENGHYDSTTDMYIASVYNKEKSVPHQVVVEVVNSKTEAEGFGQNEMPFFWVDGTTTKEYRVKGGIFTYNVNLHCRSTSRASVGYLVDAIKLGLETNMDNFLAGLDVNIPASSVTTTPPEREEISKSFETWKMSIQIANVAVHWQQVLEQNGEVLRDYGYYVTRLTDES